MTEQRRIVQHLVALSLSVGSITIGASSAWISPVVPKFENETSFRVNHDEVAWIVAMSAPGFMTGSLATRFLADNFGRRATILGSAVPLLLGTLVILFAAKAWLLYITRFLWGCGTGMISTSMPMYIVEIADKDIRATLSLYTRFTFNLGSLLVMVIGPFVSYECLNYMVLVLPVVYFVACIWIPESPYYLLKDRQVEKARCVLRRLRGYVEEKNLEDELTSMQAHVKGDMKRSSTAKEFFTERRYRKAILIAAGLKLSEIMTGGITIQNYLGRIMLESKSTMELSTVFIIFGAVRFVVSLMSSQLADRVNRRPLMIYSFFGTGLSLTIVSIYFFLQEVINLDQELLSPYGIVPFIGIMSASIISTLGFNSIIFIIIAEIFPLNIKTIAMTSLSVFGGILGFGVSKGFQEVKNVSGLSGVFWCFSGIAYAGALFVFICVPETKGKSLKEIQGYFQTDLCENETEMVNLNDVSCKRDEQVDGNDKVEEISQK